MNSRLKIATLAALMLAAPALAADDDSVTPPSGAAATTDEATGNEQVVVEGNKPKKTKICTMETATGSMMPRKKCRTVDEATAAEAKGRDTMERARLDREAQQNAQRSGAGV